MTGEAGTREPAPLDERSRSHINDDSLSLSSTSVFSKPSNQIPLQPWNVVFTWPRQPFRVLEWECSWETRREPSTTPSRRATLSFPSSSSNFTMEAQRKTNSCGMSILGLLKFIPLKFMMKSKREERFLWRRRAWGRLSIVGMLWSMSKTTGMRRISELQGLPPSLPELEAFPCIITVPS